MVCVRIVGRLSCEPPFLWSPRDCGHGPCGPGVEEKERASHSALRHQYDSGYFIRGALVGEGQSEGNPDGQFFLTDVYIVRMVDALF